VDGRLIADLGRIRQVSGRLGGVEREFSDTTQFTGNDAAFLGSADLAAALDSCVNGWSQQRSALISQLSNVARLSALAASSYERTDEQLTSVLNKAMNSGTKAPA
jgi:2-keto-3-deoxy-L-rhamnonate aldolase RhmA